jgi:hypothetical protein
VLQGDEFEDGRLYDFLFDVAHVEVVVAFDVVVADSQEAVEDLQGFSMLCDEDEVLGWCDEYGDEVGDGA